MALAVNDIIQVSFDGDLLGQRILSVLHYAVQSLGTSTNELANLTDLADTIETGGAGVPIADKYLDAAAQNYTLQRIRTQRVSPARTIYVEAVRADTGTIATDADLSNVAASLFKRTGTPGRMGIGRLQFAPIPKTKLVHGVLDSTYKTTELKDLADSMVLGITGAAFGTVYVPCLYNPTAAGLKFSQLFEVIVEDTTRTMHRRTLRVGE